MRMNKLILSMMILGATCAAQAEELTGTLKKIKDNGVIVVGHRESSVPFLIMIIAKSRRLLTRLFRSNCCRSQEKARYAELRR